MDSVLAVAALLLLVVVVVQCPKPGSSRAFHHKHMLHEQTCRKAYMRDYCTAFLSFCNVTDPRVTCISICNYRWLNP
jgi:hypothetical protein